MLMLGLAQRAGKVASGEFSTEKAVKSKKAFLVVVASMMLQTIQRKCFQICALSIKFQLHFTVIKFHLVMQLEKSFVHHWQFWMKVLESRYKNTWKLVWNNADVKLRTLCYSEKRLNG